MNNNLSHSPSRPGRNRAGALTLPRLVLAGALVGVLIGAAPGCIVHTDVVRGNGVLLSEARDEVTEPFDAVSLDGAVDVEVTVDPNAPATSVTVIGDDNLVGLVVTRVRRGTLEIDTEGNFRPRERLRVEVVTPTLHGARIRGSGNFLARGINSPRFVGGVSGSGNLTLAGSAAEVDLSLSGSGNVNAERLSARSAQAVVSGSGNIELTATESATMSVTGSGNIECHGDPARVRRSVTGSGGIHARG